MFQDNPLLAQLKQQLHSQTPRVEGVVKGTEKGFGFLEVDGQKSYFIPPPYMKKVMHGDRIVATLHTEKEREIAEPEPWLSLSCRALLAGCRKKTIACRLSPIIRC
ncbi:Exoribonuclease 2 [Serratia fonticola]|uniref:Exoribonuclease 2 n=1 Tax=Serratia fonticola TaxID=47917 RepID=A0A4V6KYL2_SERFO|nr:Exoribonuclease 2 [Serratia fonticola]